MLSLSYCLPAIVWKKIQAGEGRKMDIGMIKEEFEDEAIQRINKRRVVRA